MAWRDDGRGAPLEDVDHLARSPHRTRVLLLLIQNDWTRRELNEETDIPQPTLGRILGTFQERDWLNKANNTYSLTLRGKLIAHHFTNLLDIFDTVSRLPAEGELDPLLTLGFDPEWLAHVDLLDTDDKGDWYGHLRHVRKTLAEIDSVNEIGPGPMPGMAEVLLEQLEASNLDIESIFPRETFESFIDDAENRSLVVELLNTGNAQFRLVDESIQSYVARHDNRAVIDIPAATGGPVVRLTSAYRPVIDWVDSTIAAFRDRAETVTAADLTG